MNGSGVVTRINYNNQQRDSVFQAKSVKEVKALYKALVLFDRLLYKKENHIVYKLEQGKNMLLLNLPINITSYLYLKVTALSLITTEYCMEEKATLWKLVAFGTCKEAM